MQDSDLDRLFAEARGAQVSVSDALMARVMADAQAHLPMGAMPMIDVPIVAPSTSKISAFRNFWQVLRAGFGGTGVMASLGVVAAVSIALGYADFEGVSAAVLSDANLDSMFGQFAETDGGEALELVPVAAYFLNEG